MKLKFLLPLAAFGLLVLVFVQGLDPDRNLNELPSPFLGKDAPEFDLPKVKFPDQRIASSDYEGEIALVNFWATWCAPCLQEHPFLMQLSRTSDIPIYGINWRDQREPAVEWLNTRGDPYVASGFDEDASTGIDWGVYGAPETYLISKDGRVLYKHMGRLGPEHWEREFVPLIEAERAR